MADIDFKPIDENSIDFRPIESDSTIDFKPVPETSVAKPKSPLIQSELIRPEEIEAIAAKHQVDPDELRSIAPYYGANLAPKSLGEAVGQGAKAVAGTIGSTVGLNIPQFAYKKLQNENVRKALDDLDELNRQKESYADAALKLGQNIAVPAAGLGATSAVGRIGEAAGIGAVAGAAGSHEGEELESAKHGALLGGALGIGAEGLGRLLGPTTKLSQAELENVRTRQVDLERGSKEQAARTAESDRMLEDLALGDKTALTQPEIQTILKQHIEPETLEAYMSRSTPEGTILRERASKTFNGDTSQSALERQLVDDVVTTRARDFAEYLTKERPKTYEEAAEAIDKYASRQGVENTSERYKALQELENTKKYVENAGVTAKDQPGFFGGVLNKISDNQFALRHIDDKYGVNSEGALRDLNQANNRYTFARNKTRSDLESIFNNAVKSDVNDTIKGGDKLYSALDTGSTDGLSSNELNSVNDFRRYFSDVRDFANGLVKVKDPNIAPLAIPKLENYVPHMAKPIDELIPIVEKKVEEVKAAIGVTNLGEIDKSTFKELADKPGPLKDLVDFANWADSKKSVASPADLNRKLDAQLYSREGNIGLESRARATMERTGEMPDFILEKNLYKLADRYALNTIKHLYLRTPLERLALEAKKLNAINAAPEAEYVNRIVQDTMGVRKGTAAEGFMQAKISSGRKLDALIDQVGPDTPSGWALKFAKTMPEILYAATRNIYPNLLGYGNVYAGIQNLTTGITRLAPELGTKYGYSTVLRGGIKAALNFNKYIERAHSLGNVPAEMIRQGEEALYEGLLSSKALKLPRAALTAISNVGMKLFETSEKWNRALVMGTADMMAHDLARNSTSAIQTLRNFPVDVRKAVLANPSNEQLISDILSRHLNDVTQFNYNRSSLFEYGRTLGPLLSTFSKWPTSIAGEAIYDLRSKGISKGGLRILERLVAPYAMLQMIDYALLGERIGVDDDPSDIAKKLVGTHGLSKTAPIGALSGFASGQIFAPPAVDLLLKGIITPVFEGNPAKIAHGFDQALRNYAPGAGLLRFITDDVVTYATGRSPEGSTFVEKTAEGLHKLSK